MSFFPTFHLCGMERLLLSYYGSIQLLLDQNRGWVLLKTDIKNAFDSLDTAALLNEVNNSFPDMNYHAYYSLVFAKFKGSETVILSSEQGVDQGDPLSHVLFSTAIHTRSIQLQNSHAQRRSHPGLSG